MYKQREPRAWQTPTTGRDVSVSGRGRRVGGRSWDEARLPRGHVQTALLLPFFHPEYSLAPLHLWQRNITFGRLHFFFVPLVTGLMWPDRAGWDGTRGNNFCTSVQLHVTEVSWVEYKGLGKRGIISPVKDVAGSYLTSCLLDIWSLRLLPTDLDIPRAVILVRLPPCFSGTLPDLW